MKTYNEYLNQTGEYGVVEQVRYPIVFATGLPGARSDELVMFEDGQLGYVTALAPDAVHISALAGESIRPGVKVTRTNDRLHIPVGEGHRGRIINPLGQPIVPEDVLPDMPASRPIDITPPPISMRQQIRKQFTTGTSIVDLLVPVASGQRVAVIGDQKTGKTAFLLAAAKAHAERGIVVYAAIGRPWSEIRRITNFIQEEMDPKNCIVVASSAEDIPSLITITPFAAMTIAEYWRDQGEDVLLILHDLSTHARYYREVALLAERFPGRESYPGDIFYTHARLLERAGNFIHEKRGSCSITCMAGAETLRGDVTRYIVSNLISITDGHLYFDSTRFSSGQRPALDVQASVTRVGRQTQAPAAKQLNLELTVHLSKYERAEQFSKFGSEVSAAVKETLAVGQRLLDMFSQPPFLTVPLPVQLVVAAMVWQGWLNEKPVSAPGQWRDRLSQHYQSTDAVRTLLDSLAVSDTFEHFLQQLGEHKPQLESLCQTAILSERS